jgi:hypothetical protein
MFPTVASRLVGDGLAELPGQGESGLPWLAFLCGGDNTDGWAEGWKAAGGQFGNVVHGALRAYDLPNLLETLPPEKVEVEEAVELSQ